ncbi:hypothetical protein BGX31_002868 [Mortierella sp. GBA43]|nr:hypothetical protein BGX31_002868 [Mortierella sp. GBA43]
MSTTGAKTCFKYPRSQSSFWSLSALVEERIVSSLPDVVGQEKLQKVGISSMSGHLDAKQVSMIGKAVMDVIEQKIRVNAIGLVDAFAFPDYYLNSALGRFDGKVYEAYTEMATREPINQTEVVQGYEKYINPFTNPHDKRGKTMQARL